VLACFSELASFAKTSGVTRVATKANEMSVFFILYSCISILFIIIGVLLTVRPYIEGLSEKSVSLTQLIYFLNKDRPNLND
jgi:hypothetical protein